MSDTIKNFRPEDLETDDRFPSGSWIGFFVDKRLPGKHQMELDLAFSKGVIRGEGRDRVGEFILTGRYTLEDGKAYWTKKYLKAHDVFYDGYNEGKGIWGVWNLTDYGQLYKGGFHIWPKGMPDPTELKLTAHEDIPEENPIWIPDEELVPVGGGPEEEDEPWKKSSPHPE
ncbi:hypothetical protein KIH39_00380 [Telmatocola sphagniphila]|uniref:Uncharacterized protein n=1 Tax=Telmatocola sphagniphila TaxID=1123043 RepID=A0A8E6EYI7_9BACT|nr:hypothetical protein [Telmatocola sphagniphila]QVL32411.1 hypothetical protein KIH39_00380 [Telmatocola sphagniphila]